MKLGATCRSRVLLIFSAYAICVPIKCLLMCFYCIVTTEEDHRSVVETFGEKDKFFVEPPG